LNKLECSAQVVSLEYISMVRRNLIDLNSWYNSSNGRYIGMNKEGLKPNYSEKFSYRGND